MLPDTAALRPRHGVLAARELDAIALYDPGQERYVTLNPVATRLWELLSEGCTPMVIVERFCDEYGVAPEQVIPDVASQLESWLRDGFIESGAIESENSFATGRPTNNESARAVTRPPSIVRCGLTIAWLRWLLRRRRFEATMAWVRSAVEHIPAMEAVEPGVVLAYEHAVATAGALYPGRARCMEQSLALYYLCRRQGVAVHYCQGVRLFPFEAHAWIEYQGEVINDLPEHVMLFARFPDQLP